MSESVAEKPTLMVVEDDEGLAKQLRWSLDGFEVVIAHDRPSAIAAFRRHQPALVTMDLGLPPATDSVEEGMALLTELMALAPETKLVVLTGQHDRQHALKAVALGAYDFLAKPFDPAVLNLILGRARALHDLQQENRRLRLQQHDSRHGIVTRDAGMQAVCRMIEKVAPTNVTVLLHGESGTGKELLARSLHAFSDRKNGPFVAINCAAIPDTLLESELFGYERGAFTGAQKQTKGKIEYASGGTLFLDEIGDIPGALQAKLLRFLQERVIERLGGRGEIPIDVRVVCATHQSLPEMIKMGSFREDLFYRLSEITVEIPPLRARTGDAALLAHAFVERFSREMGKRSLRLREDAAIALNSYAWPGNVRELENCIKRSVIMTDGSEISPTDLGLPGVEIPQAMPTLRDIRDEAERKALQHILGVSDGNILKAAELLGVSRPTLYDMLKRHGLKE